MMTALMLLQWLGALTLGSLASSWGWPLWGALPLCAGWIALCEVVRRKQK